MSSDTDTAPEDSHQVGIGSAHRWLLD